MIKILFNEPQTVNRAGLRYHYPQKRKKIFYSENIQKLIDPNLLSGEFEVCLLSDVIYSFLWSNEANNQEKINNLKELFTSSGISYKFESRSFTAKRNSLAHASAVLFFMSCEDYSLLKLLHSAPSKKEANSEFTVITLPNYLESAADSTKVRLIKKYRKV